MFFLTFDTLAGVDDGYRLAVTPVSLSPVAAILLVDFDAVVDGHVHGVNIVVLVADVAVHAVDLAVNDVEPKFTQLPFL